jgi:MFS family permease
MSLCSGLGRQFLGKRNRPGGRWWREGVVMAVQRGRPSSTPADAPHIEAGNRRYRRSFWVVAFAYLAVMALSTVPSPLYGLYRARDHFSVLMLTVIYAVYAGGVISALLLGGHVSDWYGRRRVLVPAMGVAIASDIVFLSSKSLAGLITARVIDGISVGIIASTATAYLSELHSHGRPRSSPRTAELTASAVSIGGVGVGALAAGALAQWVPDPLTVPYLVFLAALVLGAVGVALAPETRDGPKPRPRYRPQRPSVPQGDRARFIAAAITTFMSFAAQGLFVGLAGLFLSVTLHHPSLALNGAVLFAMFAAGVGAQLLTAGWPLTREFEAGMGAMIVGLGTAVVAVWLRPPSLGLFIAGGVLIGAGAGAIFKGAIATVMSISSPDRMAQSLAAVFLCAFVGLSIPVVGAGITLARHVTPKVTMLGFATAVSIAIAASAFKLASRAPAQTGRPGDGVDDAKDRDGASGLEPTSGTQVLDVSPDTPVRAEPDKPRESHDLDRLDLRR